MEYQPDQDLERRSPCDRRIWHCEHNFPYVDSHGYLVTEERRSGSDRRELKLTEFNEIQSSMA